MTRHSPRPPRRRARTAALTLARRRQRVRRSAAMTGMVAVVGALVAVRSAVAPAASPALAGSLARPVGTTAVTPSRTSRPSPTSSAAPSASSPSHAAHTPATAPRPVRRSVTGDPFDVGYGTVQVRVVLVGHRIEDVTALSLPSGGRSSDISAYAGPHLRQEALAAQSARIDTVSGASYTSAGYARSLQSALDKA